jgi:CDP-diacylglycerol---glycerol-3-phosphate 3-phosphatidyltransferase
MAWVNLPNLITLGRIGLAIIVVPLLLTDDFTARAVAFVLFLAAAFSDLWDGHLARSQNLVTDFGKLMDPLADKLLLAGTFIPFYLLARFLEPETPFPWFGGDFPLWILIVIFGRELFITVFRGYAAQRGIILAAGTSGKVKAVFQSIFIGAGMVWYALQSLARERAWDTPLWEMWLTFHRWFTIVMLVVALVLTVYSMGVYLVGYARLQRGRDAPG